jgi:hypothetical protein
MNLNLTIKLPIFAGFLMLWAFPSWGQPDAPEGLNSEALRTWLKAEWYDPYFDDLGYNGARTQMFGYTDEEDGLISGIYTGYQQPSAFVTYLDPINTEHIVPQSFFGSLSPMKSDLFNIRPTHGSANSARGNTPYGLVANESAQWYGVDANGEYITQGNIPPDPELWSKRSGDAWEPPAEQKGDIARKVFYFYTMYPTQAGELSVLGDADMFYDWHLADPVDDFESTRNARVAEVQGNSNPYISHPEWVETAWFWSGVAVPGCTDPVACNYDAAANEDDGSCTYAETGLDCSGNPLESCTAFFSEYAEGSSNNKYLEIYNPGLTEISLEGMALAHTVNEPATPGSYETWVEFPANSNVAPGSVYRVVHSSAAPALLNAADFIYGNLSNGDDGFALVEGSPTDFVILDIIGDWNGDPGSGWDVAGIANATQNHTLVRKPDVLSGNGGDWNTSAGSNAENSEWIVLEIDDWSNFGEHTADGQCDTSGEGGGGDDAVAGCTYANACNYNIAATDDDGSCDFTSCETFGCTYSSALNFNDLATVDDGTCLFGNAENSCATDINADGIVTVADLLLLLTDFGATCPD